MKYFQSSISAAALLFVLVFSGSSVIAQYKSHYPKTTPTPTQKPAPKTTQTGRKLNVLKRGEYRLEESKPDENGLRLVSSGNQYGYINNSNEDVIPISYDECRYCKEGLYACREGSYWGFVDTEDKTIIEPQFSSVLSDFISGKAEVEKDGRAFFIDESGEEIVIIEDGISYEEKSDYHHGLARVRAAGKYGFINEQGKQVVRPVYDYAEHFYFSIAAVHKNNKEGFINLAGKLVVPLKYDVGYNKGYNAGVIRVMLNGKCGVLDSTGKVLVPLKYDEIYEFASGFAGVRLADNWGTVNKTGKVIIPVIYQDLTLTGGIYRVKKDNKFGYINSSGKTVIPIIYDNIDFFLYKNTVQAKLGDKTFSFDNTGKQL